MPVSTLTLVALWAGVLLLTPTLVRAQSRIIVTYAHQLEDAPAVKTIRPNYEALAAAYVVYDQCGKDLSIADEKKAYLASKFTSVSREYQIAYQDAYVAYVGTSPSQELVDDVAATIKKQQQKAVNNMALLIRKKGCQKRPYRHVLKYVDNLYATENAAPKETKARAPKINY